MHCRTCAKELSDQAIVCPGCGCAPTAGTAYCQNCGGETNANAQMCVSCGVTLAGVVPPGAKSKLVAGLLGIFLGGLGIHRFYLGFIGIGIAQIVVTLVTFGFGALWGLIEGILILVGNMDKDAKGQPLGP